MCGIAGIYHFKGKQCQTQDIKHFSNPINHRGPDAEGFELYNNHKLGLAHKRLSILDTSSNGSQPMKSHSGRYHIVYNGEVFNFIELKNQLTNKGYQFTSETDTEVILAAFEEWGTGCFNKFNGMWAMAIFDNLSNELILSRDRFGIKPLYFQHYGETFAFASETNCFKNIPGHSRSFNFDVLKQTMADPYYANSIQSSIYEGIEQLKPGCYMHINASGMCSTSKYYDFHASCAAQSDIAYTEGDFKELFIDAVSLRLRSDVPVATAFSGGLDSTAVFSTIKYLGANPALLSRVPDKWQSAFCMVMEEDKLLNDLPYAKEALKELKSEAIYIHNEDNTLVDDLIYESEFYDDIIGTPLSSVAPIYKAMKANGFNVSMDGHGADEYLFGYRGMVSDLFYKSLAFKGKGYTKRVRDGLIPMYSEDKQGKVREKLNAEIKNKYTLKNYVKRLARNTFLPENPDKNIVSLNVFSSPLPSLLKTFDKASMLHGVEIRMPFMDYRLIELCYNLHNKYKIREGKTKWILRDELKNIMPKSTLNRTYKIGIQAPVDQWLSGSNSAKFEEIINDGPHKKIISEIGKDNFSKWSLLNLQLLKP